MTTSVSVLRVDWLSIETSSSAWETDPLHFQFPPTKNFRASALVEAWYPLHRQQDGIASGNRQQQMRLTNFLMTTTKPMNLPGGNLIDGLQNGTG